MLVQKTVTRRESGADVGVKRKQQTPSLGKIILQTLKGGKPTRKLQDILSIILITITRVQKFLSLLTQFPLVWETGTQKETLMMKYTRESLLDFFLTFYTTLFKCLKLKELEKLSWVTVNIYKIKKRMTYLINAEIFSSYQQH